MSRSESLELVGSEALRGWSVNVLQRLAETDSGVEITEASLATSGFLGGSEGLHAKTFVFDLAGGRSVTVTGSANLTSGSGAATSSSRPSCPVRARTAA